MNYQKVRLKDYNEYLLHKGYKKGTVDRYIKELILYFESVKQPLSQETYTRYLKELTSKMKISSVKRIQSVLNNFYNFLYGTKLEIIIYEQMQQQTIEYISKDDLLKLINSIESSSNYSGEKEYKIKKILLDRNITIIALMGKYGFSLSEITELNMNQINFHKCYISLANQTIHILREDMDRLYRYYMSIPSVLRPFRDASKPVFVSFDNIRMTYSWSYENDEPKRLTDKAIQKLVKKEARYAGIPAISAQRLRNTAIIESLKQGKTSEEIKKEFRLTSVHAVNRYRRAIKNKKCENHSKD